MTSRRLLTALIAACLVGYGATLPLWTLTMTAPQYPKGLRLHAFGSGMTGDISELNILNHYIGMPPIQAPALETALFPYGIALLAVLCLVAPVHRWVRRLAMTVAAGTPLAILADLQWQLYTFGHSLNPRAPIRLAPFTPLVLGQSSMGNFVSFGMVSWGFVCFIGALMLLVFMPSAPRSDREAPGLQRLRRVAAGLLLVAWLAPASAAPASAGGDLQVLIDRAAPGSTVHVPAGTYAGRVVIHGPLSVVADGRVVIDGGGVGSVVSITGTGVQLTGFTVRNSGRQVTEEAAGIKVAGSGHRIERNRVEDVYFGIHLGDGSHVSVRDNVIAPGVHHGARPGHGISAWRLRDSDLSGNRISNARDGIYLSFTERVVVRDNVVTDCRYGFHSMYSRQVTFEGNTADSNLLGAALMMSDRLVFRRNTVRRHRAGAAAYGVLLKDIGDLLAEENHILSNRIGIYAEGVPASPANRAVVRANVIAGNEVGFALQSTAALVVSGNRIAENLTDVRALGRQLAAGMQWSQDHVGNSWGQYRGFDRNRDGIGDVPYQLDDAMDALIRRNDSIQAFLYTPAHLAVEAAARMFPVYRQPPLVVDHYPLMQPFGGAR